MWLVVAVGVVAVVFVSKEALLVDVVVDDDAEVAIADATKDVGAVDAVEAVAAAVGAPVVVVSVIEPLLYFLPWLELDCWLLVSQLLPPPPPPW